jgi:hypothetical protein
VRPSLTGEESEAIINWKRIMRPLMIRKEE